jgi:hypothetical protein
LRATIGRATAAIFTLFAMTTAGLADEIPADIQGKWAAEAACEGSDTVTLTATTVAIGGDEPQAAEYYADDSPAGNGAVHFAEEGDVSNWEYATDQDVLLYNEEGYGMGVDPVVYERCT